MKEVYTKYKSVTSLFFLNRTLYLRLNSIPIIFPKIQKMKKNILLLLFLLVYLTTSAQDYAQNNSEIQDKPFSLKIDKKTDEEIIKQTRAKILKGTAVSDIILNARSTNLKNKLQAIEHLGYAANSEGRLLLETYLLYDKSVEVRIASAQALGRLRSVNSKKSLIKALEDKNRNVKTYAALALSFIGEKSECFNFFSKFYEAGEDIPFYSCHIGFTYIASPQVRPFLVHDLNNQDTFIAVDAAIILAQLGFYSDATPVLKKFLSHSDKYIRMAALRGLAYIGDKNALELISSIIDDPDEMVKERAKMILEKYESE